MSEKVLKPKATLLSILGCILIYDLTTKTHDVASLRAYRGETVEAAECIPSSLRSMEESVVDSHSSLLSAGPALLAFTLVMCAYSLRTWRRNGVACDELLFLPGTPHGDEHGIQSPAPAFQPAEGDMAAGIAWEPSSGAAPESPCLDDEAPPRTRTATGNRSRSLSGDSSLSSIRDFANSWDEGEDQEDEDERLMAPLTEDVAANPTFRHSQSDADRSMHAIRSSNGSNHDPSGPIDRFSENHPRITRIGSFFFFRSSSTSTQSAAYAPSGPSVVGAALDLCMPILFNFHLFIEAFNHYDAHGGSETPAKILPLIFLTVLMFRTTFPPGRRGRFWGTMKYTFMAPFHASLFRDSFLGDVLTSLVRPFQDIAFALAYYVTVVYGTVTSKYGLSDSGRILESSRILHNVVLPSCALLPLWWKFLQTLREGYDTGQRWPYLGNAFKYLTASLVILYGMTHPEDRPNFWWILSFMVTLLYQIWWDTIMDWELFVIAPKQGETLDVENHWCRRISSVRPNSYVLLSLQRNIFQPARDIVWFALSYLPNWKQVQLRPRRLYKSDAFYWRIFAYNTVFRAAWMLCYIPSYHMDGRSFNSDVHSYLGVLLPVAEILRRTLWGFLLLEVKTIKISDCSSASQSVATEELESLSSSLNSGSKHGSSLKNLPSWLGNPQQLQHDASTISTRCGSFELSDEIRHKLFITELSLWAVAFIGFGLWATT